MTVTIQRDPEILKFKKDIREFDWWMHEFKNGPTTFTPNEASFCAFIDKWNEILEFADKIC